MTNGVESSVKSRMDLLRFNGRGVTVNVGGQGALRLVREDPKDMVEC